MKQCMDGPLYILKGHGVEVQKHIVFKSMIGQTENVIAEIFIAKIMKGLLH